MQEDFETLLREGLTHLQQDHQAGWFDTVVDHDTNGQVDEKTITEFRWAIELMYNGIQDLLAKADDTAKSVEERKKYLISTRVFSMMMNINFKS